MKTKLPDLNNMYLERLFNETFSKYIKLELRNKAILQALPERSSGSNLFTYGKVQQPIILQEMADYLNVTGIDWETPARTLGAMAASVFNCSMRHAVSELGHKVIVDPMTNNMKFHIAKSQGPTVIDPCEEVSGWVAFRFYFGSGIYGGV